MAVITAMVTSFQQKKRLCEALFWDLKALSGGLDPSQRALARHAKVSAKFAKKIIREIKRNGAIVPITDIKEERWEKKNKGVGCFCLSGVDINILLQLRDEDSTRSNASYVNRLLLSTGTTVSESFISTFFQRIGPYRGNFRKLPTVPIDKYRPSNIITYQDYLNYISVIPPHLIHFGDEKSLKGTEVFNRKGRVDPTSGENDQLIVPPYFRNTFCIMGMTTINRQKNPPFLYSIGDENHDSAAFLAFMVMAVATGWLSRGDFIVIDNAILHSAGSCDIIHDFLWSSPGLDGLPINIVIVPFPTRAPELNPIELNWNTFVLRLKKEKVQILIQGGGGKVLMEAAGQIMSNFSHEDNEINYIKRGYYGKID